MTESGPSQRLLHLGGTWSLMNISPISMISVVSRPLENRTDFKESKSYSIFSNCYWDCWNSKNTKESTGSSAASYFELIWMLAPSFNYLQSWFHKLIKGFNICTHLSFSNFISSPTMLLILFRPVSTPWMAYLWTALSMFKGNPNNYVINKNNYLRIVLFR